MSDVAVSDVGVIDFGDVAYHDASRDFAGFGDETVRRAALDAYGASDELRARAEVRARALPVLDLPFYVAKRDERGVRSCIDLVRHVIVRGAPGPAPRHTRSPGQPSVR